MSTRLIKFRVWNTKTKEFVNDELAYSSHYYDIVNGGFHTWDSYYRGYADNWIVQQSIELLDKNGKDIYEGDIVKCSDGYIGYIDYHFGGFHVRKDTFDKKNKVDIAARLGMAYYCGEHDYLEVIGNILENPELLK